jgi:ATP-dependent DNA helicase RecG
LRPEILFPLFTPTTALPGIGPRLAKLVEHAAGPVVADLLWHLPSGIVDRRFAPKLADAPRGVVATLTVTVDMHYPNASPRLPYRIRCSDETGFITLVFFHVKGDYLSRLLPPGALRVVSGKVEEFNGQLQMTHPDHIAAPDELDAVQSVEPVYGLTAGLPLKVMRKATEAALARAPALPEWLDPSVQKQRRWPTWRDALAAAHHPETPEDLEPLTPARIRLAYDELLADQLAIALIRAHTKRQAGRRTEGDGRLTEALVARLPFQLTGAQRIAWGEVAADMAAPDRMLRLLQGDVGSGKTVVALLAMLGAVEAGVQAALMAPTEILARQHHATILRLLGDLPVRIGLLTGRDKGKPRERLLEDLADGRIDILIGTHALFQEGVGFQDLALAVIDEQHRFGVEQRVQLAAKGRGVDILVMTATPIPRSLMMTSYGDLDASRLAEKPMGRLPIRTSLISLERLGEVVGAVERALGQGAKVYWVCPLVEESELSDLAAAGARYETLADRFGGRVGLVHGKLKPAEKDRVMAEFAGGGIDLLVATTVIEVGVDVPEATVMVIEHAERFGLAQLHQLRGRIGRGAGKSSCLLLYQAPLGAIAKQRLTLLRETEDGFRIAEEDLKLRGAGDVLGTKQSGLPAFRVADLASHQDLLAMAHDDARLILARDPDLASPRGRALRTLLYLFARDASVKYLRA